MSNNFVFYVQDRVRTIGQEAARLCEIHPEHAAQIQVNNSPLSSHHHPCFPCEVCKKLDTTCNHRCGSEMCIPDPDFCSIPDPTTKKKEKIN